VVLGPNYGSSKTRRGAGALPQQNRGHTPVCLYPAACFSIAAACFSTASVNLAAGEHRANSAARCLPLSR